MVNEYLDKHKSLKHLAWSSLATFGSVFLVMFSTQLASLDLSSLEASEVTSDAVAGAVITVARLALIAIAQALQFVILKAGKRS